MGLHVPRINSNNTSRKWDSRPLHCTSLLVRSVVRSFGERLIVPARRYEWKTKWRKIASKLSRVWCVIFRVHFLLNMRLETISRHHSCCRHMRNFTWTADADSNGFGAFFIRVLLLAIEALDRVRNWNSQVDNDYKRPTATGQHFI